ncbi:hypothetical protein BC749_108142 [Flavobacterium araucananum]|uniref:Uncharacterized protein n=1 Tax=Flavobacterium araucananum TaxID=946678 RepID=A0A227NT71_9FLAO|nr:hypothetical protein [Flavobacterium araucananum]OXG00025.1 hypothetical protein B0A64_20920 [Flavobacterium araucananum]PWJ96992.1 hypothetical protein BC749_108142 [Flavobacterium araucananum]
MSLNLLGVENATKPDDEYVILQATAKISLKGYAIVDKTFNPNEKVSNEFRHIFFFPDVVVEKDDLIALCTGKGEYERERLSNGSFTHQFYWQSSECAWNDNGDDNASLINYTILKVVPVPAVKK